MKIQAQMASFEVVGQNAEFFEHEHSIPPVSWKIKIKPSILP